MEQNLDIITTGRKPSVFLDMMHVMLVGMYRHSVSTFCVVLQSTRGTAREREKWR